MRRKTKRWVGFVLTASMIFTSVLPVQAYMKPQDAEDQLHTGYSKTADAYQIYPVPQKIDYEDKTFTLGKDVNVVYGPGIDEPTKDFLEEVLEKYGRTISVSASAASGKSNVLIGINEDGGAADTWVDSHGTIDDAELFTRTDAYFLDAEDGTIAILGRDTDAAFNGVATLQMMFSSFAGDKFLNAEIEDYASMAVRGFIEGFYGGWDYPSRQSLMRFARDLKMNTYVYASKTDSYHKSDALYPNDDIKQIEELVKVGKETKVEYAWSVHISYFFGRLSGMTVGTDAYNTAFEQNFTKLVAKFQQLYDAGVRKFDILNDDFGQGSHTEVVRLLNKLDNEFLRVKGCERMSYCMQGYNQAWSKAEELEALKSLNDTIDLYWTGSDVNSPITQETVNILKEKTGHNPIFWLNYPVNEHGPSGIYLGDITHYARDGVTGLAGAVSNPCRFPQASKVALFQLASLFWNNNNYLANATELWEESFKYLQPEVYDAYLTIARNVANCPGSGRVKEGFPESEYLKERLDNVSKMAAAGVSLEGNADVAAILKEFEHISESIDIFREKCENEELIAELDPWLKSLNDIAAAGKAVIKSIEIMQRNSPMEGWGELSAASKAMETQNTYPTYAGSDKMALAGSKYLAPFVETLINVANEMLSPYLGSAKGELDPKFYAKLAGKTVTNVDDFAKVLDGDPSTYVAENQNQAVGDYYGIDFGTVVKVKSISVLQGKNDTDKDIFNNGCIECSEDGKRWTELKTFAETDENLYAIEVGGLSVSARYVRIRLTKKGTQSPQNKADYWTHIRDFTVDWEEIKEYGVTGKEGAQGTVTLDDRTYSLSGTGDVTLASGEYVGLKLEDLSEIVSIANRGTGMDGLTLQYSENGVIWKDAPTEFSGETARYVRVYNSAQTAAAVNIESLDVTVASVAMKPSVTESSFASLKDSEWKALFDGNTATSVKTGINQAKDQYILVDLGATTAVYDLQITMPDDDPLMNGKIQISKNKETWEDIAVVTDKEGDAAREDIFYRIKKNLNGKEVRYLKILVDGNGSTDLGICDIDINKTVQEKSLVISGNVKGDLKKIVDGNFNTIYQAEEPSDGTSYIEYKMTENTRMDTVVFLQDGNALTNASVTAQVYDGKEIQTRELGILNYGAKEFKMNYQEDVLSFRVTWPKGTIPALYEIITTQPSIVNLAVGAAVAESGKGNFDVENAVDGNLETRWEGNEIKGEAAAEGATSWISVDLGTDETIHADQINVFFYKKAYATNYDVQASDDGETWETFWTVTNEDSATMENIENQIPLDSPITKRYVRLLFHSMNENAAGNAVSIKELEIYGPRERVVKVDNTPAGSGTDPGPDPGTNPGIDPGPDPTPGGDKPVTPPQKPDAPSGLSAFANTAKSIRLSWNKVDDAAGYIVSRCDQGSKSWKDIATVTVPSYQNAGLKGATIYQYRVRAFKTVNGSRLEGASSGSIQTATAPAKTKIKAKKTGNKVKLTWNKKAKADGFEIYMKQGKKNYRRVAKKGKKVVSYSKKLKKGQTYQFRLRSYKKVGGEKIYSVYSNVKKIKM